MDLVVFLARLCHHLSPYELDDTDTSALKHSPTGLNEIESCLEGPEVLVLSTSINCIEGNEAICVMSFALAH